MGRPVLIFESNHPALLCHAGFAQGAKDPVGISVYVSVRIFGGARTGIFGSPSM
ncbi:MAG: hypothetical protein H7222_16270 [Methylotenera sp.]|nr:hypothetical protein [Oligoflexia bacterium]